MFSVLNEPSGWGALDFRAFLPGSKRIKKANSRERGIKTVLMNFVC